MYSFIPKSVLIEEAALAYPLGAELHRRFQLDHIPVEIIGSHNRVRGLPGLTPQQAFAEAKRTLVVGVRKTTEFETCKPSANYQLPLATSCPGMCEYCYLQTTLGKRPYLRVYVNTDEILARTARYIAERRPDVTTFEGAATSDPIPTETYTGSLAKTIEFFAGQEFGRFRFVTKFTDVGSLLQVQHGGHTRFRVSLNSASVIRKYEHQTPSMEERVEAAGKVASVGYPLGFIIAPIFYYDGWKEEYALLVESLARALGPAAQGDLTFELITHRFTARAKRNILDLYPESALPMDEEDNRRFKYGQFGYGKYIYAPDRMAEVRGFFQGLLAEVFPGAKIEYLV